MKCIITFLVANELLCYTACRTRTVCTRRGEFRQLQCALITCWRRATAQGEQRAHSSGQRARHRIEAASRHAYFLPLEAASAYVTMPSRFIVSSGVSSLRMLDVGALFFRFCSASLNASVSSLGLESWYALNEAVDSLLPHAREAGASEEQPRPTKEVHATER